jgi:hypothetical protein
MQPTLLILEATSALNQFNDLVWEIKCRRLEKHVFRSASRNWHCYPGQGCPAHGNSQSPSEKRRPTLLSWKRWRPWNRRSDACFLDLPFTLATGSSVCCEITTNPRMTTGSGLSYQNPPTPRIEPSAKSFLRFGRSSCWAGKSPIGLSFPATVRPLRRKPCTLAIYSYITIRESAVFRSPDVKMAPCGQDRNRQWSAMISFSPGTRSDARGARLQSFSASHRTAWLKLSGLDLLPAGAIPFLDIQPGSVPTASHRFAIASTSDAASRKPPTPYT